MRDREIGRTPSTAQVRQRVGWYAAAMIVGVSVVQAIIATHGHRITLVSTLALAVVALGYLAFNMATHQWLRRVRYGRLTVHAVGYVIVNGSYWLHATWLWTTGRGAVVDADWYGSLFGMGLFWGLGLTIHTIANLRTDGFEEAFIA